VTSTEKTLKRFLKDQKLKVIDKRDDDDMLFYRLEGPTEDREREVRRPVYSFCIYKAGGRFDHYEDRISKTFRHVAKFLCVNGPLQGQWKTPEAAGDEYSRFNRDGRGNAELSAVLVHGV